MKVGVIGASGYAGGELLRLLSAHPHFQVSEVTAHSNAGEQITSVHPHLTSFRGRAFSSFDANQMRSCDLVFLALPHGESAGLVSQLSPESLIVDLGADFRLESSAAWSRYYTGSHAGTWVYGLPELERKKIQGATRVANPGCYATAIALGAAPAAEVADLSDIVVVAASGTTGAGRSAKINLIASEVMGSLSSYKFGGVHQHTPEIEEVLERVSKREVRLSFTPILAPQPRGILATLTMKTNSSYEQIRSAYEQSYEDEIFVDLLPQGQMPRTSSLTGSNKVQLQVALDDHTSRLVVSVALDNLGKGAAGQAIQNANIIAGLDERAGLLHDGVGA